MFIITILYQDHLNSQPYLLSWFLNDLEICLLLIKIHFESTSWTVHDQQMDLIVVNLLNSNQHHIYQKQSCWVISRPETVSTETSELPHDLQINLQRAMVDAKKIILLTWKSTIAPCFPHWHKEMLSKLHMETVRLHKPNTQDRLFFIAALTCRLGSIHLFMYSILHCNIFVTEKVCTCFVCSIYFVYVKWQSVNKVFKVLWLWTVSEPEFKKQFSHQHTVSLFLQSLHVSIRPSELNCFETVFISPLTVLKVLRQCSHTVVKYQHAGLSALPGQVKCQLGLVNLANQMSDGGTR